jgi:hypothetical protein
MALSRRVTVTAGAIGLTVSALFAASGSAFAANAADAADDGGDGQVVIVEQAQQAPQAPSSVQAPGDCSHDASSTAAAADTR